MFDHRVLNPAVAKDAVMRSPSANDASSMRKGLAFRKLYVCYAIDPSGRALIGKGFSGLF